MRTHLVKLVSLTALAVGLVGFSNPADAASKLRSFYQNAASSCNATDTWGDFSLTRFANRLVNTDDSSVSVVCSFQTDAFGMGSPSSVFVVDSLYVYVRRTVNRNNNGSMTCTMTSGYYGSSSTVEITKMITLPSDGSQVVFGWSPADNTAPNNVPKRYAAPINIRCSMPRDTELNDGLVLYYEDVGA